MFLLATSSSMGDYFIVDNIWEPREYFKGQYVKRMRKHLLRMDIIEMVEWTDYDICIFKTFWISIFQRKVRKWLASRL